MTRTPDGDEFTCSAGREADFGGKWLTPCNAEMTPACHELITAVGKWKFCEAHMLELIAAGLVTDPYVERETAEILAESEREELRPETEVREFHFFGPRLTWKRCDCCQQRRWWLFDYENRRVCGTCVVEVVFPT